MNIKDEYKKYFDNVEIRDEFVENLKKEINSETVFMGKYSITESSEKRKFKFKYIIPTAAAITLIFTSALAVFNSNNQYEIDVPIIETEISDITETTACEINSETSEEKTALTSFNVQSQTDYQTEKTTDTTTIITETTNSLYEDKNSSLYTTYKNETPTEITTTKEETLSNEKTSQPPVTTASSQSTQITNYTSVIAGNNGSVVMSSENDTDIEILMFEIKCDSNITINDVSCHDKVNGKKLTYYFNPAINQCIVSTADTVGIKTSDIAVTIEFSVNEDTPKGDYEFEINVLQCCNIALEMIEIEEFGSAFITIL